MIKLRNPQNVFLFFFAVAFLLLSMAVYQREHYPFIVIHNPAANIAELAHASRDEAALRTLMRSGFAAAAAMLTASHPYEFPRPKLSQLNRDTLRQFFSEAVGEYVQQTRRQLGFYQELGTINLVLDTSKLKIRPSEGSLFFEGFFTREFPTADNRSHYTQFRIQALGNLAPVTGENPYGVKFTKIKLTELDPLSKRSQ